MECMMALARWHGELEEQTPVATPFTDSVNKRIWLETIQADLSKMHGPSTGLPLSYVIRKEAAQANPPATGYVLQADGPYDEEEDIFNWEEDLDGQF